MASWSEVEAGCHELAEFGATLLDRFDGLAFIATVRQVDGAPRLHPVCPWRVGGRLFLSVGGESPKQRDLRRDGRYVLHALPGKDDAEFRLRGHARQVVDPSTEEWARNAGLAKGLNFRDDELLFELDIDEAHSAVWVNAGQPGTYPVRRSWTAHRSPGDRGSQERSQRPEGL
jgi:hypothetical protein